MTTPFPLQIVLELMQERADDATKLLARLIALEQDAKKTLEMLLDYRDEYATRFAKAAQNGLNQCEWRNFQEFLSRLDEAIDSQRKVVAQQVRNTEDGQENWKHHRKNLKAFDTLADRHYSRENTKEIKRDQKIQDEFAARMRRSSEM